jgi:hypothetical protein
MSDSNNESLDVVVSVAVINSVVRIPELEFAAEAPYSIVDDIFIPHCQFEQIAIEVAVAEKYIYILYQHISFTLSIKRFHFSFSYLML